MEDSPIFQGVGGPHSPLLYLIEQDSQIHYVEQSAGGFVIRAKPGWDIEFEALAKRLVDNEEDGFSAFGEPNGRGAYKAVYISPYE